jgi:hypothetical protein
MVDRDALAREMGEQLKRLMYDLGNGNPWSLANFMSEIAMRHIAAARAEALEEAADWLTTRHIMTEAHNTLAEELRHARDRGSFLDAVAIAERHIVAARVKVLGEAARACNKIHSRYSLTGNAEQVSAWVTSNECENAIRALAQSTALGDKT